MSDKMPPITLDEMIDILKNPNFKTYLVLGEKSDDAWKLGQAAQNYLAGVRAYLVEAKVQAIVRTHFKVPQDHVGIVFGRSDAVIQTLDRAEASDFLTVTQAVNDAG